jgi:hypothetical protein
MHYVIPENEQLKVADYPPGAAQHLQNRPFDELDNNDVEGQMHFMHHALGPGVDIYLQNFIAQRRASPATQNAPNGFWERVATVDEIDSVLETVLSTFKRKGKDFKQLRVAEIWAAVVKVVNTKLGIYAYGWSPKYQKLAIMFTREQKEEDRNQYKEQENGQGKPKKCRKCGLYKR